MNWVLAALTLSFYFKLRNSDTPFLKYWAWFFLLFTVSFFFGGLSHLLFEYTGMKGKIPGWSAAIFGVTIAEMALLLGIEDEKKRQILTSVVRAKIFATFVLLFINLSFTWVMVHTAGFWVLMIFIATSRMKSGQSGYKYFLIGMSFLFVIAAVKVGEVDVHPAWFTRDDIAHFIMLAMYWMYYKGVLAVQEHAVIKATVPASEN